MSKSVLTKVVILGSVLLTMAGCTSNSAAPTPVATPPPTAVTVVKAARGSIEASLVYPGNVQTRAQVPIVPEVAGRLKRLAVDVGSEVKAGDVIAEVDASAYDLQVAQAEAALAGAQAKKASLEAGARDEQVALASANLKAAQERLATMNDGGRAETIAQAEANLAAAQARLDQAKKGPTPEQLAIAEQQLKIAKDQEYLTQQNVEELSRRTNDGTSHSLQTPLFSKDIGGAQSGVAYENTKLVEAQIAQLTAPPTPEQLAQLQAAVDVASQQLALAKAPYSSHDIGQAESAVAAAEQQLSLAKNPYTANDLNAAKAAVQQAQVAVDLAKLQRQKATIISPLEGIVAQRLTAEGSMVGPTGPILVMVARDVEVSVQVEEARLSRVRVGQAATLSVAAYPGEKFPAELSAIAPSIDQRSRAAQVKIRPKSDPRLLDGMFAQVSIVTGQQSDALLVPATAVVDRDGKKVLFVSNGGSAELREVKLGFVNGKVVEVVKGVAEGEDVVTSGADGLSNGQPIAVNG
ncbi:MAG: efflux RND transporter periplasmic adaptor subunit [Chloroflexi bacterium]|nr:efflux RND transporter periplasmic adaptor subunit [Chloroflexota bacterium]MCL5110521.1 efflux RND transporter periplasmic adaptor subunit [Chloroflexota bacterium]